MSTLDLRHARMLIVEDSLSDIALIKAFFAFEKISNHMHYATTLKQASELVARYHFDLCFVDVLLPDGNGFELAGKLPSTTTFVMLSAGEGIESLLTAQGLGAVAYINKPITKAKLDRLIKELKHMHWSIVVREDET